MPTGWPTGIGLEEIFTGGRRGIINLSNYSVEFIDSAVVPFGSIVKIPLVCHTGYVSPHKEKRNRIVFGAPGTGKSFTLNYDRKNFPIPDADYVRVTFHADYSLSLIHILRQNR